MLIVRHIKQTKTAVCGLGHQIAIVELEDDEDCLHDWFHDSAFSSGVHLTMFNAVSIVSARACFGTTTKEPSSNVDH